MVFFYSIKIIQNRFSYNYKLQIGASPFKTTTMKSKQFVNLLIALLIGAIIIGLLQDSYSL